jgi:hypothetical protein
MRRRSLVVNLALFVVATGCQSGGVGDPCVPEDEYQAYFSGYALGEINIESRSFQCETRLCLVNHFQGRVSCPYGQSVEGGAPPRCHIPGSTTNPVRVDVRPWIKNRRATDAVYCSCRCDGPDPLGRYCKCPAGFACTELLQDIGVGKAELAGSYCVKAGTEYGSFDFTPSETCNVDKRNCEGVGEEVR